VKKWELHFVFERAEQIGALTTIHLGYEVGWHYQSLIPDASLTPSQTIQEYINSFNTNGAMSTPQNKK
jgi:hypothetical protein